MFFKKKSYKVATIMGLVALAGGVIAATVPPPASDLALAQREAREWVARLGGAVPKGLEALAAQPLVRRKAVLAVLTVGERERLWGEQLSTFVTPDSLLSPTQRLMVAGLGKPLTSEQQDMIRGVISKLHEGIGESRTPAQRAGFALSVCEASKVLFTKELATRIFVTLGPVDTSYWRLVAAGPAQASVLGSVSVLIRAAAVKAGVARRGLLGPCICYQEGGWCDGCPPTQVCTQSWPPCDAPIDNNCGCLGNAPCNGGQCSSG